MSLINTNPIWLALGDFYNLFPDEDRVYWDTFWEAYSDIVADLWGFAFQVDRAKSLFATTATMERRNVLVQLTNLDEGINAHFRISNLKQDAGGRWLLRGFVPRDMRSFTADDLPDQGSIHIGVDVVPYVQVNVVTVASGVYEGFVREAVFVLSEEPPHDYIDDPNFNEDFSPRLQELKARIDHAGGSVKVDAVVPDGANTVSINPTGRLTIGVPGSNVETVDYESVSVVGDRYVFTLATSWQSPDTGPEELSFSHVIDEPVFVESYDQEHWRQNTTGLSRVVSAGSVLLIIDQDPAPAPARAELLNRHKLRENVDFDVSVVVDLEEWPDPGPVSTRRDAFARLVIGTEKFVLGIRTRRTAGGDVESVILAGDNSSPEETAIEGISSSYSFETRFKRLGAVLELQFRSTDEEDFRLIHKSVVTGEQSTLDLVVDDPDSETASRTSFDEVIRRAGDIVNNTRLTEQFSARPTYPYTYDIDQNMVSASELRDRPRTRTEFVQTTADINTDDPGVISATAADNTELAFNGIPESGVIDIEGTRVVYDSVIRDGDVVTFSLREKLDPDIIPLTANTVFTVTTNTLKEDDYRFTGAGQVLLKDKPTRDRMWAPVAQIDIRHVQNTYGKIVDLDAEVSTDAYLNRVQGTWYTLMSGPSISNVHTGMQLAMGLPVAKTQGTITNIVDDTDSLGRIKRRYLTILGPNGSFEHDLLPSLYPFIDWNVSVGQAVEKFEPLTNGVEVMDVVSDNEWHLRFPGVADIERFNSFGVFVAIEALSANASVEDAVRFALRIKPTYTKMVLHFILTSGDEDLSEDIDDEAAIASVPNAFEDMSFDEGQVPDDPQQILRLGEGHKLGQGKKLGGMGIWHPRTLGVYKRQGPFIGDGQVSAGDNEFVGSGAYSLVEEDAVADGLVSAGSDVFTTGGAYAFSAADVGNDLVVLDSLTDGDNDAWEILELISPTQVRVDHVFESAAPALDWKLRVPGFVASDVGKNIHVLSGPDSGDHKILEVTDSNTLRVFPAFTEDAVDLDWEMRDYSTLSDGHELGEFHAYRTPAPGSHQPLETVDAEQVMVVATSP